jgi:integrase
VRLKLYRGKWAVVWHDGARTQRRSLGTADRHLAERRFRDVKIETDETVADAAELYLREKQGQARSYDAMQAAWKATKPTFGHLRPDQITKALCRDYARKRKATGRKNGTIIRDLAFLRAALKWAKRPGADFQLPSAPAPRDRYLTKAEYDRLLAACKSHHMRLFVILALATAGRASAILELTWDRVDFERGRIQLAKEGEERRKGRATVPMNERARAALSVAYEARTCEHVIEYGGMPVKQIKRGFRETVARAGLKDVSPHVLRHTAGVWMAEAGVSIHEIASFLGHTDIKLTFRVYSRHSPDYLQKAAKALE